MSFLQNIQSKILRPTTTTITHPDGQRFIQSGTHLTALPPCPGYIVDTKPDNVAALILPTVFLGSKDCCDRDILVQNNIKNVLSIGIEAPNKYPDINYHFVECLDLPETCLKQVLEECFAIIEAGDVLVHCNAGVSRSASVLIGFLIVRRGFGYEEALALVKAARSCVKPNVGFERQLRALEKK